MELFDENAYLSSYYAKRKLDLYSAIKKGNIIYFKKRVDDSVKSFNYNIST